jgi:hypothetical protein
VQAEEEVAGYQLKNKMTYTEEQEAELSGKQELRHGSRTLRSSPALEILFGDCRVITSPPLKLINRRLTSL